MWYLAVLVVAVAAIGAWFFFKKASPASTLDVNKDGKIDAADAKAAVVEAVQEVKQEAIEVKEQVVEQVKQEVAEVKQEVVEQVKKTVARNKKAVVKKAQKVAAKAKK